MNMIMTLNDAKGAIYLIIFLLLAWSGYNSEHSDNGKLQVVTSFQLGLMIFMVLFYIVFSTNKQKRNLVMKQLKLSDVDDHLLLEIEPQFSHEIILTSLDDDEYCAIDLRTSEGITYEDESVRCDSAPELLGEVQKHCDIYFMEDQSCKVR